MISDGIVVAGSMCVPIGDLDSASRRGVFASLVLHVALGVWVVRAQAPTTSATDSTEIDLDFVTIAAPPIIAPNLDPDLSGSPSAAKQNIFTPTRAAAPAAVADKNSAPRVSSTENDIGDATDSNARELADVPCEGDECVLEALNRCLAGDGDGCVGVGLYYERGRSDPFSAIKWYVKGCGLSSQTACAANERVKDAKPVPWRGSPWRPHT